MILAGRGGLQSWRVTNPVNLIQSPKDSDTYFGVTVPYKTYKVNLRGGDSLS